MVKTEQKNSFDTHSRQKETRLRSETQYECAFILIFALLFLSHGTNRFDVLFKILCP